MPKFRNIPIRFKGLTTPIEETNFEKPNVNFLVEIVRDRYSLFMLFAWLIIIAVSFVFLQLNFHKLPHQIPLYYSRLWGEAQLAQKSAIFLPIAGAFIFGLVNFLLIMFFKKRDNLFNYLLLASPAILSLLAAITIFNIISLIG